MQVAVDGRSTFSVSISVWMNSLVGTALLLTSTSHRSVRRRLPALRLECCAPHAKTVSLSSPRMRRHRTGQDKCITRADLVSRRVRCAALLVVMSQGGGVAQNGRAVPTDTTARVQPKRNRMRGLADRGTRGRERRHDLHHSRMRFISNYFKGVSSNARPRSWRRDWPTVGTFLVQSLSSFHGSSFGNSPRK